MAYSTIPKGNLYMNPVMYTGTGSTRSVTGVGFQPDWTWIKGRSTAYSHNIYDSVRGVTKIIKSNSNTAEDTQSTSLTAFNTDGFTLGSYDESNYNSRTYASWNWKAGTSVSGTTTGSGTGQSYTGSVNTTAGFSIIRYPGNNTAGHEIPHNLGVVPSIIFVKKLNDTDSWIVYTAPTGRTNAAHLNTTDLFGASSTYWNDVSPTSSVFTVGGNQTNEGSKDYIAYSFSPIQGYSRIGQYTGNGSSDGTLVYTGFKPAYVMYKGRSVAESWKIYDNTRQPNNVVNLALDANSSSVEDSGGGGNDIDFLSNGFKQRGSDSRANGTNQTYIYMAFAENPFVATSGTNAIPVTAR